MEPVLRYACKECDYVSNDRFYAEDHASETGHGFREVEHLPVVSE